MENKKGFLKTADNVSIAYEHHCNGYQRLVIICPGFFNSMKNRWMRATRDIFAGSYDTCMFDFRGHGASSGTFLWTAREHLDLEAVLAYAQGFSYAAIGIVGFSLGAAISITCASRMEAFKSMALISAPCSFWEINYHFWEPEMFFDLKDNFACSWEGKGARTGNLFMRKPKPLTNIKHIKHIPILFIHGTRDWIIKDYHSRKLYNAYDAAPADQKKLVLVQGGLHAERLVQYHRKEIEPLLLDWFGNTLSV